MSRIMTRDELEATIIQQAEKEEFYRIAALNYKGVSKEGISYGELIAEWLYGNFHSEKLLYSLFSKNSNMKEEGEKKEYLDGPIHKAEKIKYNAKSKRNEEKIAIRLFQLGQLDIEENGIDKKMRVTDYQVPVNRASQSSEGKVDLVLTDQGQIVIAELKDEDSQETLLRAVVEAKAYQYKIQGCKTALKRYASCYAPGTPNVNWLQPAVMIFAGEKSHPWSDFDEMSKRKDSWLKKLITAWDMKIYLVTENDAIKNKPYHERNYSLIRIM